MAGCAADAPEGSLGQLQNLRFELTTPTTCDGCGPDRELPVGAVVTLDVYNLGRRVHFQVRSSAPAVADFQSTPRCMYLDAADCHETVSVRTHAAGSADLEIFDEWTGTVLDRYTVKVVDIEALALTSKR